MQRNSNWVLLDGTIVTIIENELQLSRFKKVYHSNYINIRDYKMRSQLVPCLQCIINEFWMIIKFIALLSIRVLPCHPWSSWTWNTCLRGQHKGWVIFIEFVKSFEHNMLVVWAIDSHQCLETKQVGYVIIRPEQLLYPKLMTP